MRVTIDTERCCGYGNCVFAAPDIFDVDEATNLAFLKKTDFDDGDREGILDAVADCPTDAISADQT